MYDTGIKGMKWHIVNNNCVELRYEENNDISVEANYISEITAVFTTANARMRLYDMLDWLHPSQVLYCDTDSVMILYDKTNPNHKYPKNDKSNPKTIKFGDAIGEWENEFKEDKSKGIEEGWITELVIGGAKSYAYITNTGKIEIRQKGITLDRANSTKVSFETMRDMVLKRKSIKTEKRYQFRWDNNTKDIVTVFIDRSIKATIGEKRTPVKYDSVPYGYEII